MNNSTANPETFEGTSRFRRNDGIAYVMLYGMLGMFALPFLALLSPISMKDLLPVSRDWIGLILFLGGYGIGTLCGIPALRRLRGLELEVNSSCIQANYRGKEIFYSKWEELRWRRGGSFIRTWVPVDPMGRKLPNHFTGGADYRRFQFALKSHMPQGRPPLSPTQSLITGLICLPAGVAGMLAIGPRTREAAQAGLLGQAVLLGLLSTCFIVIAYVGLFLFTVLMSSQGKKRQESKLPERAKTHLDERELRQAIYLTPGIRYRYVVPAELEPSYKRAKERLGDIVSVQLDGSLHVQRGDETFVCQEPLDVYSKDATARAFTSFERWKKEKGGYVIDRRYLVPVEDTALTE